YDLAQVTNDATTLLVGFNNNAIEYYIDDICLEGTAETPEPENDIVRWTGAISGNWDTTTRNFATIKGDIAENEPLVTFKNGISAFFCDSLSYKADEPEAPDSPQPIVVAKFDFEDDVLIGGWGNSSTREIADGEGHDGGKCEKINNPSASDNSWDMQAAINFAEALTVGQEYVLHFWAKSDTEITVG
ncbi:MAG: hypothetical protein ACI4TW_08135, partial [Prevotella sp.]